MTKILFAIIISMLFTATSFAQNSMMMNTMNMVNNNMMMALAAEEQQVQQQAAQPQQVVVIDLKYQADGTLVANQRVVGQPVTVQTVQEEQKQIDPGYTFFMGGILGLLMGAVLTFTVMRWVR